MRINTYIDLVKQRQREIAESMAEGRCASYEIYQRMVGTHQGLQQSLDIINNLLEEEKRDDS